MRLPINRLSEVTSLNAMNQSFQETEKRAMREVAGISRCPFIYEKEHRNRRSYLQSKAHRAVRIAVLKGELPDLKASIVRCVDCGMRATDWDHRDYGKPLEVEPTCGSCNCLRGPATVVE